MAKPKKCSEKLRKPSENEEPPLRRTSFWQISSQIQRPKSRPRPASEHGPGRDQPQTVGLSLSEDEGLIVDWEKYWIQIELESDLDRCGPG